MKLSVEAQFGYFPLVWMFYGRELNRKINHMHEDLYALSKKITIALSMIYLRKVSLSVLTIENLSNFVKIICIELDMLTWLMTNPFFCLSFDTGHRGSQECFHIYTGGCCKHLQMR